MTWEDILKGIALIIICVAGVFIREAGYKTLRYMRDKFLRK
jgi:hypothetical protein